MKHLYANIFVEYVTKNPLREDAEDMLHEELFIREMERYIRGLNIFV
jgi:hypothetical protein